MTVNSQLVERCTPLDYCTALLLTLKGGYGINESEVFVDVP